MTGCPSGHARTIARGESEKLAFVLLSSSLGNRALWGRSLAPYPGDRIGAAHARAGACAVAHRGDTRASGGHPGPWTLSGLLDFESAMTGDRAYEFAAAGLFISRGDPRLLGRILAA